MDVVIPIHARLSVTAAWFIAAVGVWALVQRIRNQPLSASWYGALVVGEVLLIVQALLGVLLYMQGYGGALPRPFMHILYGVVSLITIPAAYSYFGSLEDEKVKALAMAAACAFLWGIILRASYVAESVPPGP
jgi:hypothetical protein